MLHQVRKVVRGSSTTIHDRSAPRGIRQFGPRLLLLPTLFLLATCNIGGNDVEEISIASGSEASSANSYAGRSHEWQRGSRHANDGWWHDSDRNDHNDGHDGHHGGSSHEPPIGRCPPSLGLPDALLVVDHPRADGGLGELLREQGFEVRVREVNEVQETDADGKALVVIAEGAGAAGTVFRAARVPVVVLAPRAFVTMGLTGPNEGVDFGFAPPQKLLTIVTPASPLAAGLIGTVRVTHQRMVFGWGKPAPSATIVATLPGYPTEAAVFGYETGAILTGLRSPARRVGFFSGIWGPGGRLNETGERLLRAAIHWAATPRALLVVGSIPLSDGDTATATRDAPPA